MTGIRLDGARVAAIVVLVVALTLSYVGAAFAAGGTVYCTSGGGNGRTWDTLAKPSGLRYHEFDGVGVQADAGPALTLYWGRHFHYVDWVVTAPWLLYGGANCD